MNGYGRSYGYKDNVLTPEEFKTMKVAKMKNKRGKKKRKK